MAKQRRQPLFNDPGESETAQVVAAVEWADAKAAAGALMLDAEIFPPTFYVSKFPTPDQFARMPGLEM